MVVGIPSGLKLKKCATSENSCQISSGNIYNSLFYYHHVHAVKKMYPFKAYRYQIKVNFLQQQTKDNRRHPFEFATFILCKFRSRLCMRFPKPATPSRDGALIHYELTKQ